MQAFHQIDRCFENQVTIFVSNIQSFSQSSNTVTFIYVFQATIALRLKEKNIDKLLLVNLEREISKHCSKNEDKLQEI